MTRPLSGTGRFYKWELIILLWLAFFLNQADRQIFNVVLSLIKSDLQLTDAQLGLVAAVLIWTYGLFVPLSGYAGDVWSRKKIIGISLLFWSVATVFTGVSATVWHLILLRGIATGGGEAFYAPSANALISEYHHKTRAFAMSLHQTAVYFGIVSSGFLAGYIGEQYGWRSAFYLFGFAGVLLAVVIFLRLKNNRSDNDSVPVEQKIPFREAISVLFQKPTAVLLTLAFAGMVFVNVGYLTWMPTFLLERFGLSLSAAGFNSMFYHHAAAFAGVLIGGKLSDRWAKKRPRARLEIQAVSFLLGAPFIYLMGVGTSEKVVYLSLAGFGFFRGVYDSNIFASLYEVIAPRYRSSASGVMLMGAFLTGAFAPYLLGVLKPTIGLAAGIAMLSVVYLFSAAAIGLACRFFFTRDYYHEVLLPEQPVKATV